MTCCWPPQLDIAKQPLFLPYGILQNYPNKLFISSQTGIPNLKEATVFEYENRFTKNSNNKANCEPKQTFDIFVDDAICSESNENESSVPTPLPNVVAHLSHQPLTDVPVETVTG